MSGPPPPEDRTEQPREIPPASSLTPTDPPGDAPDSTPAGVREAARSVRVSYLLWCLWLLGFGGLHRIYNRQWRTGLLWLLTFGLCGIGQLVDLFLIRGMVASANGAAPPGLLKAAGKRPEDDEPGTEEKADGSAADASPAADAKPPQQDAPEAAPLETDLTPPLDLLRERRQQLDVVPLSGLFVLRPALVRRGLWIGGLSLAAGVGICVLLALIQQLLRAREAQLVGYEQQATQLRESIAIQQAAVKGLQSANDQFVKRLSDVRSSSALLADLQRRVPDGVQLAKVQMMSPGEKDPMGPTEMRLEGQARDPVGFGRVNAMELVLRRSPLFLATGVTIEKAERVPEKLFDITIAEAGKTTSKSIKLQLPSAVNFEMKATLSPLAADEMVTVMENLEAQGMARRLRLLQREGLLK